MIERNAQGGLGPGRIAILAAVIACALAPGLLHAASGCVRVRTDAPVFLPDGGLYPAGTLTLCDSLALSPVTSLHKTYVNGRPIGLLASRRRPSEVSRDSAPLVVFHRDFFGRLELVGYVLPAASLSDRSTTFVLAEGKEIESVEAGSVAGPLVVLAATRP